MKTLILPDLHLRTEKADAILVREEPYDKVIWLSDLFDQFVDNANDAYLAALWLKEKLKDNKNIFIWANHDISYAYDFNPFVTCSGFTREKSLRIWQVLNRDDFNKFHLYHIDQGVLFTHAGLSNRLIKLQSPNEEINTLEKVSKWLDFHYEKAKFSLENGGDHWLFGMGFARGGTQKIGGVTWEDWGPLVPTPFPQILGHTSLTTPCFLTKNKKTGGFSKFAAKDAKLHDFDNKEWALNLDTHLNDYAILEDEVLTIRNIIWQAPWNSDDPDKNKIKTTVRLFKGGIVNNV